MDFLASLQLLAAAAVGVGVVAAAVAPVAAASTALVEQAFLSH